MWGPIGPQTKIHYLHLPKWNRLFAVTLHIKLHIIYLTYHINIYIRIRKVPLLHPWATFLSYKQKMKWPSEPNEQDIQYPITSLIFVIENQTWCLYPCFQGQGNQFLHLICNRKDIKFFDKWLHCNSNTYLIIRVSFKCGIGKHYLKWNYSR